MKAVLKISFWAILLLLAGLIALFLILQTSHSGWLTQQFLSRVTDNSIQINESHYQYPDQLTLSRVTIAQPNNSVIAINSVQLSFEAQWRWPKPLSITNVLISGVNLPEGIPDKKELDNLVQRWQPQHIEIRGMDFANNDFIARDIQLTYTPKAPYPEGYLNIDSDQVYWKGEAFDNFKARINYVEDKTQLDLVSFNWRGGEIQFIAEKNIDDWVINDALVRNLQLSEPLFSQPEPPPLIPLLKKITSIEHLEIERSSWQANDLALNQMHLQLSNWDLRKDLWTQDSPFQFSAESVAWHEQLLLEPQASGQFASHSIQFDKFTFLFEQGQFTTSGKLSEDSVHLNELEIKNLEWSIEDPEVHDAVMKSLHALQTFEIDKLKVERSQLIDISTDNHWQVSNVNAEGRELILKKDGNWALWNGSFAASANSLSAFGMTSIKPYLETDTTDGLWHVRQLFVPINDGLIKADSSIDLGLASYPWQVSVQAYGLPLESITHPLDAAVGWNGLADLTIDLSGLGGDELMLKHSLDGQVKIAPHDVQLTLPFSPRDKHTVIIPEVNIEANRGVVKVSEIQFVSQDLSGSVQGSVDLVDLEGGNIKFHLSTDCLSLSSILPKGRNQISMTCPKAETQEKP
ncbi:AsmA family protein [Vibrio breoganii]